MSDEIVNELIDILKQGLFEDKITFSAKRVRQILDYINDLQEENKELKIKYNKCKKQKIKVDNACSNYKHNKDKAIEYINEHIKYECDDSFNGMQFYSYHLYDFKKEKLLNILKGDNNEI